MRFHRQESGADDRTERLTDEFDARAVERGGLAVQADARNRTGQHHQVGAGLAQVVARGQQILQVDEIRTRRIDCAVGTGCASGVVFEIKVEGALLRTERGERRVADIERIGLVGQAMQRRIDGDHREALSGQRRGDREHVGAVARDAVLEDHHRPAGRRLGLAGIRIRHGQQHRDELGRSRHRKWICEGDQGRGRIETGGVERRYIGARRGMPETMQRRERVGRAWRTEVVGNLQHADIDVGDRWQADAEFGKIQAGRGQGRLRCRRLFDATLHGLHHRRDRLRGRDPGQHDALVRGCSVELVDCVFLRIDELTQRFERAGLRGRQQRIGGLPVHAQRAGALGEEICRVGRYVVAGTVGDARRRRGIELAAVADQHDHVGSQLLQRTRWHDGQGAAAGIRWGNQGHEILRRLEFAGDAGDAATGSGQAHLENAHRAAGTGNDGRRFGRGAERGAPWCRGGESVQCVQCDLRIAEIGGIRDRNVQSQIRGSRQQQVGRKRHYRIGRIEACGDHRGHRRTAAIVRARIGSMRGVAAASAGRQQKR